jgi:HEAT repeat protein
MGSVFNWIEQLGPAGIVFKAVVTILTTMGLVLVFILLRRALRQRYLLRRDLRTLALRKQWQQIVDGTLPPETWFFNFLDRSIVESMIIDRLEVAAPEEAQQLRDCLASSGLLHVRIHEARTSRGWRQRHALLFLGRMRTGEVIPAISEGLDSSDTETRLAAVRGLGRTGLPQAAHPLLERYIEHTLNVPERPLQNSLVNCCQPDPSIVIPYIRKADDETRPLLARVLSEIATPALEDDLLWLSADADPEVRASVARALSTAKSPQALTALTVLASDPEWFVRLRAAVGLGEMRDPRAIPVLLETLCDPNRYVRLRSAAALAQMDDHLPKIVHLATKSRDRYALQALLSEMERSGGILKLLKALSDPKQRRKASAALLEGLRAGTQRMLLNALVSHPDWRVRTAVARLLADSGETRLIEPVEKAAALATSEREKRISLWVLQQLRSGKDPAVLHKESA